MRATTAMMMPIARAALEFVELKAPELLSDRDVGDATGVGGVKPEEGLPP
jgi:hypothetical protein